MKKHPTVVELSLLVPLALVVVLVYGVREFYVARAQRAACHRANLEKLNYLEPSVATINTEVQEIQQDQDVIDQLGVAIEGRAVRSKPRELRY